MRLLRSSKDVGVSVYIYIYIYPNNLKCLPYNAIMKFRLRFSERSCFENEKINLPEEVAKPFPQRVHVGIWEPHLGPKYILYTYMDALGFYINLQASNLKCNSTLTSSLRLPSSRGIQGLQLSWNSNSGSETRSA